SPLHARLLTEPERADAEAVALAYKLRRDVVVQQEVSGIVCGSGALWLKAAIQRPNALDTVSPRDLGSKGSPRRTLSSFGSPCGRGFPLARDVARHVVVKLQVSLSAQGGKQFAVFVRRH